MNKKIIAALLSAVTALTSFSAALADDDKVEIAFKVGDSILKINGVDTEVETPYVAGEGVTLVPLRVITEAFGSQVDWEGETKTITLTYPDVNIALQIGNIIATVNDHSETLLEPPALSENGVTMVPLRFISETFGATVGYDNDTQAILVTKERVGDAQTVTGITEMSRTGDSYYGWSIDTPVEMKMTDRRLDGLSTTFTADDGSQFYVDVYKRTKDTIIPFDEEFLNMKDSFSGYTLTEAEKLTDAAGNKYMRFQGKDKNETVDFREYYGKDYTTYDVISYINNGDDSSVKDMLLSIAESFRLGSFGNDTYDLSNVSDGMRAVKDDKYKVSFSVPADFRQPADSETENEFYFYSNNPNSYSYVSLAIYSRTSDTTAQSLAQSDRDSRVKYRNGDLSTISDVTVTEDGVYRYTVEVKGASKKNMYLTDTFFEKGDYVYNFAVAVDSAEDADLSDAIMASLQTEELDLSVIGRILRNDSDDTTLITRTVSNYTFELPASWKASPSALFSSDLRSGTFIHAGTGSMMSVMVSAGNEYSKSGLSSAASEFSKYITEPSNHEMIGSVEYSSIGGERFAHFKFKITDDDGEVSYATVYIKTASKELIMFTVYEEDIYYHKDGSEDLLNALSTLKKK